MTISKFYTTLIGLFILLSCQAKNGFQIFSPDKNIEIQLNYNDTLKYQILYKGKKIVEPSAIYVELADKTLGIDPKVKESNIRSVNQTINPLYGKFKLLTEQFNEIRIDFENNYSLIIRAYNEGVAYRFVTDFSKEIIIKNEMANFCLAGNPEVIFPETNTFTSWEVPYVDYATSSSVYDNKRTITPVLFSYTDGVKVVIAESDLHDYPGMYLKKTKNHFCAEFAQYPDSIAMGSWGNFVTVVQKRANYIAKSSGKRAFPWRIIIPTDDDKTLLANELVYKLAEPQKIADVSWIKPGKAAWEWWHDAMLPGAEIPSGMDNRNTALYKHYIDFASQYHLEYLMIDAGWSHIFNLSKVNPKVNVQELINYGKSKNVGVFLWCVAAALRENTDEYMQMIRNWGVVGLKVDFFDRDDQLAIEWMETIAKKAAEHKLMINFHGCSKPTGLQRTYPNIVNFEAVRGAECSKWDYTANPQHHLTFPFTRMLAGSLDYTPGSMRNKSNQSFKPVDPGLPSTLGTRCHELAMYVVYDQYFAMLCDSPEEYRKYPDIMRFLSSVPVSFDNTKILSAEVGKYALVAKQKGNDWYIGGMTNWTARNLEIDFSFLQSNKKYTAEIYRDRHDSNMYGEEVKYVYETKEVNSNTKLNIDLVSGGGTALRLKIIN